MRTAARWLATVTVVTITTACSRGPSGPPAGDPSIIQVDDQHYLLHTGPVGLEQKIATTYVFVDATNRGTDDRLVFVEADVSDAAGQPVSIARGGALRIPAGATRTFALLAPNPAPTARSVRFRVTSALPVDYPATVIVDDLKTGRPPSGALSVVCKVTNTIDRTAKVVIVTSFYDSTGRIVSRPSQILELGGKAETYLRFEGPPAAVSAAAFVGEMSYFR